MEGDADGASPHGRPERAGNTSTASTSTHVSFDMTTRTFMVPRFTRIEVVGDHRDPKNPEFSLLGAVREARESRLFLTTPRTYLTCKLILHAWRNLYRRSTDGERELSAEPECSTIQHWMAAGHRRDPKQRKCRSKSSRKAKAEFMDAMSDYWDADG